MRNRCCPDNPRKLLRLLRLVWNFTTRSRSVPTIRVSRTCGDFLLRIFLFNRWYRDAGYNALVLGFSACGRWGHLRGSPRRRSGGSCRIIGLNACVGGAGPGALHSPSRPPCSNRDMLYSRRLGLTVSIGHRLSVHRLLPVRRCIPISLRLAVGRGPATRHKGLRRHRSTWQSRWKRRGSPRNRTLNAALRRKA